MSTPDQQSKGAQHHVDVAIQQERERCARLVEVYARVLDESITGGMGDSARTLARCIRDGVLPPSSPATGAQQ